MSAHPASTQGAVAAPPLAQAAASLGRGRGALVVLLVALAVVGWLVTDDRMSGMDAGPNTDPGTLGFFVTVWVVMMAAMMFPSISPMVVVYARIQERRRERGMPAAPGATACFVAGYLVVWAAAGLAGYALAVLTRSVSVDALSWDRGGPYLAGGVILAAGAYQLTPLKDRCLARCRGPLAFVLDWWRDGRAGGLRMGIGHGAWCVGCCWGLMAALFALGVMSVGWMAFVAALIAVEKLAPWRAVATRGVAVVLVALGLAVALVPESVPGLTEPGAMAMEHEREMPME